MKDLVLLLIGVTDVRHTFRDDITHGHGRVGRGRMIFGLCSILDTLPHLVEAASFRFGRVADFRTIVEKSPSKVSPRLHRRAIRIGPALILLGIITSEIDGLAHWFTLRRHRRGAPPS